MTARWRPAIVCVPRRWDGGSPCRAASQRRSRGLQSDTSPGRRTDHPSAGVGERIAAKPSSGTPARLVGWPAKRRAAVGGGRAGRSSRPAPEFRSRPKGANGREPGRPAPPLPPPRAVSRCGAQRVGGTVNGDAAPRDVRTCLKTLTDRYEPRHPVLKGVCPTSPRLCTS